MKLLKKKIGFILLDALIVTSSFLLFIWIKPASLRLYLPDYIEPFIYFLAVWLVISFVLEKYKISLIQRENDVFAPVLIANVTIVIISFLLMRYFHFYRYSRMIVYGTVLLSTFLEITLAYMYFLFKKTVDIQDFEGLPKPAKAIPNLLGELSYHSESKERDELFRKSVQKEIGKKAYEFINAIVEFSNPEAIVLSTATLSNVERIEAGSRKAIINLRKINNIKRINKFFEEVNSKLPEGGVFVGNVETYVVRYHRIMRRFPKGINKFYYYFIDFPIHRVAPKVLGFKKVYFLLTRGKDRVLSKAETLGRLYSCGFEVIEEKVINDRLHFVARKIGEPVFDKNPTYGPLIKLKRYAKGGKLIGVYKFRTMHPYSEYLQAYVHKMNDLDEGGKFKDDFRVHTVGKYMRKLWIDEFPMFINVFKGEMKIVGVRPLSKHYFGLYSKEMQAMRTKYKPGLVPPFYVDMPKTFEEILASERKYLEAYAKAPFRTDVRYFFMAFYNIIIKKARSN